MEEEGKDDWSLDDWQAEEAEAEVLSASREEEPEKPPGNAPLFLSILGFALPPLLLFSFFFSWKRIEAIRESGGRPGGKLFLAFFLSLIGVGFYVLLAAYLLLLQAGL